MATRGDEVAPLIEVLGTGNAFTPPGRMHACMIIDRTILIDAPPTILSQLTRAKISTAEIKFLLITHWHADHIFGLPFLLLHRRYVSDPENARQIRIYLRPSGPERLSELCETAFPGALAETIETRVEWETEECDILGNSGWKFERFPVSHTPETDPHGYQLKHDSGFVLLHCGDSGRCSTIDERLPSADVVVLEMGVPDFVETPHHHRPSDIIELCLEYPNTTFLVTHSFAADNDFEGGFETPELPGNVIQLRDGECYRWSMEEQKLRLC
jgi:ribonuclease BN (tRNA processing enzyme)